jgi:hypothetical protein
MARMLFRLSCGLLCGAQIFFAAVAAQVVFSREVAALPREHPRRQLAAELVGAMLSRLDAATIALAAVAAVCAFTLPEKRRAALPLIAGLCAVASAALVTPAIHALRVAGETASPRFGMLHGVSSILLLIEMILLAIACAIG